MDSWTDEHSVFFGKSRNFFCSNLTSSPPPRRPLGILQTWVVEHKNGQLMARLRLDRLQQDFSEGYLFVEFLEEYFEEIQTALVPFISFLVMNFRMDVLKIFPMNEGTRSQLLHMLPGGKRSSLTFSTLVRPIETQYFQVERFSWFASDLGQSTLEQVKWLQKRLEREEKMTQLALGAPTQRPWLLRILSFGRRRKRRKAPLIHPLDAFRQRPS